MSDFRGSRTEPTRIRRRSLLATFAGVAAALTINRRSDGAERFDSDEGAKGGVREPKEIRGNQMPATIDLKALGAKHQVASIARSANGYRVTTVSGKAISFTEFDLRFKTDSSAHGPGEGHPVLIPASMRTDRAFVVFASLREISAFVDQPA